MEKEPIRIAQIMGKWLGGGVESVVMNYYRHIDKNKIQFDFICDDDSTNIPYEEIERMGGNIILIPPYQNFLKYHKELKKVLKDGKYKIVHSHINTLSVFSLFAAKCAGVPVRIAHSHSTTNRKEKKKNLMKQILRLFAKVFATDYMCCSELAGRWLFGNKQFEKGNVYIINDAIDLEKFKFDEQIRINVRKELNISKDTYVIGHAGRFVEQKNHDFLLNIFEKLALKEKKVILMLIGQGPLEENIHKKVKKLGLEKKVIFLGQRSDINDLYQAMDVFAFPSIYEGLGMVAVEAQVNGLGVVCSTNVPKEAMISDKITFLSLNENEKWVNELEKQMNNRKAIPQFNKELYKYDIEIQCKSLENKYEEMIINERNIKRFEIKNK